MTENKTRRPRRTYTDEFKNQLVQLHLNGKRHFKASGANTRTKIAVIKNNVHKYSVSAMCSVLQISRSTYYYESKEKADETKLTAEIKRIFRESRNNYGTRKIKKELDKLEWQVSRRRIGRIMKQEGLVSNYTVAQYKPHVDKCNESKIANVVNRQFKNQPEYNVVGSDLTYARVGMSWNYICVLVDLFNREIIGYSVGRNKDAVLVSKAFSKVKVNLNHIKIFHTDYAEENTIPKFSLSFDFCFT